MARPRRIIPLEAEVTGIRTEAEPAPETPAVAPARTPARQRLADAIRRVKELEAEAREAGGELSKADDAFRAACERKSEADMQLKRAQPIEGTSSAYRQPVRSYWNTQEEADLAAVIETTPPMSIAEAKVLVATAQDDIDSAQRLRQHWRGRGDKAASDLQWQRDSTNLVRNVLRHDPALHALAAECKRAATASAAANMAFHDATGGDVIQPDSPFYGCTKPTDFREDVEGWMLLRCWRAALDALATDPDAPFPMPANA